MLNLFNPLLAIDAIVYYWPTPFQSVATPTSAPLFVSGSMPATTNTTKVAEKKKKKKKVGKHSNHVHKINVQHLDYYLKKNTLKLSLVHNIMTIVLRFVWYRKLPSD